MITITLRALPGVDADRALRQLLRYALRACGLRCTRIVADPLQLEPAPERDVTDKVAEAVRHSNDVASDG